MLALELTAANRAVHCEYDHRFAEYDLDIAVYINIFRPIAWVSADYDRRHIAPTTSATDDDILECNRLAAAVGVGGTGVLTITALVAMAAHIEGKGCATMNQTGLAQKFGAVVSHVRVGQHQDDIKAVRIPAGEADLLLGCDLVVTTTGNYNVCDEYMLRALKSGAVVCNIGHFDNEIDTAYMRRNWEWEEVKPQVHKVYRDQASNDHLILLSEGRLVNLGNATGHPSRIMDGSFANQVLAQIYLYERRFADLEPALEEPMVLNDAGVIGLSLNGKSFPGTEGYEFNVGDWAAFHYYNEGLQIHPMHLHQFPQLVYAKDGIPLDQPYWADTVNVAPGERYSVLFQAARTGVWVWHCHILTHVEREEGPVGSLLGALQLSPHRIPGTAHDATNRRSPFPQYRR